MPSSCSYKEYSPFVPEVLRGFNLDATGCNITAKRGPDGVLQMSYTINWRVDEACAAMAGLVLKDKAKSRKSRSEQRQRRSRSCPSRSRGSNSRQRKSRASPFRSRPSSRRSAASLSRNETDERSFLGIPSPRANLLQMMGVTLVLIERKGKDIQEREAKNEKISNEKLYTCIKDMLATLGTTLSSLSHTCPVRLFYKRLNRLRPISYEDFRKMHLNHFNAIDGTLTFVLDLTNSVHV